MSTLSRGKVYKAGDPRHAQHLLVIPLIVSMCYLAQPVKLNTTQQYHSYTSPRLTHTLRHRYKGFLDKSLLTIILKPLGGKVIG